MRLYILSGLLLMIYAYAYVYMNIALLDLMSLEVQTSYGAGETSLSP